MDIIKLSTDWAKAEVFSAKIVWLFSIVEIAAAISFWYLGKTAMAKAFGWPLLLAGLFLVVIGAGLFLQITQGLSGLNRNTIVTRGLLSRKKFNERQNHNGSSQWCSKFCLPSSFLLQ